jgi:hypothetical protein
MFGRVRRLAAAALVAAAAGCAPRTRWVAAPAPADVVGELAAASAEDVGAVAVFFRWRAYGPEGNLGGDGALRLEGDSLARVDLLGPGATAVWTAVSTGDRWVCTVGGEGEAVGALPPPGWLWALVGRFRPPPGPPLGAYRADGAWALEYAGGAAGTWRFEFDGDRRLRRVTRRWGGRAREELALRWDGEATVPSAADYRDHAALRRIRLEVVETRVHARFDPAVLRAPCR